MNIKFVGIFEIVLIVLSGVAFSYIISETNDLIEQLPFQSKESKFISFIRERALSYLSSGIVSAQSVSVQTCLLDKSGASCQEYTSDICNDKCSSSCFPGRRSDFASCKLGTCYDSKLGICSAGTPKASCENQNGVWSLDTPVQCNRRCCLINPDNSGGASQAKLSTQQECNNLGKTLGAAVKWDSQISDEFQCISKVKTQREGACVLELLQEINKYNCKFTTEAKCLTSGGKFYANILCTNPTLNTKCDKTSNTKCFDGKDGVYFIDSCGNKANVYDSNRRNEQAYWNSVIALDKICSLSSGKDSLANQQRCGNCDYLKGSICGTPKPSLDKSPVIGQYVCKNLNCVDRFGNKRNHGESWCAFDGRVGVDGKDLSNEERAVDVPGSRHYVEKCYDGEIRLEPCASYRNGICVENKDNSEGNYAKCEENKGLECLDQNKDPESLSKCEENPFCFVKRVDIQEYKFDFCSPKYPVGFELKDKPKDDKSKDKESEDKAKATCSLATRTCSYYDRKGLDFRWTCKINCACKTAEFAETMNNFCMSLGDCGGQVNLASNFSASYSTGINANPKLSQKYIDELKKYATSVDKQAMKLIEGNRTDIIFGFFRNRPHHLTGFEELYSDNTLLAIVGYIISIIFWIVVAIIYLAGAGKYREGKVEFKCLPWQPPAGGSDCSKCHELGVKGECTEYKCNSLGKTCELINKGSTNEACVDIAPNDASAPQISFNKTFLKEGFSFEEVSNGVKIKSSASDGCLQESSPVSFDILTNEPAQCKISTKKTGKYKDMEDNFFDSGNDYVLNHVESTSMPDLDTLGVSGADPTRRGDYNLYVLCQDKSGNSAGNAYNVRFCVSPEDDSTPPKIEKFAPESPGFVGLNAKNFNLQFFTNEPATCRFSSTDQKYETMEGIADCKNDFSQVTIEGLWSCSARLNVTQNSDEFNYHFRCADKPWLGEDVKQGSSTPDPGRNVNEQSITYVVKKTTTPLTISSISLKDKTITSGVDMVSVTLDVTTSGGINNGKALCNYDLEGVFKDYFSETNAVNHKQIWSLIAGDYVAKISCIDSVGNAVEESAKFKIYTDSFGPLISRIYNAGTSLKVITNEASICEYSTESCVFEFGKGTALTGASKVHSMSYSNGKTYSIKCKDSFGNVGTCLSFKGGY